jgi:hypothetical protein
MTKVVVEAILTGRLIVEFSILVLTPKLLSFFFSTRLRGLVFDKDI